MSDKSKYEARMAKVIEDDEDPHYHDDIPPDPPMCSAPGCDALADVMLRAGRHDEPTFHCWGHAPEEIRAQPKPLPWRDPATIEQEVRDRIEGAISFTQPGGRVVTRP